MSHGKYRVFCGFLGVREIPLCSVKRVGGVYFKRVWAENKMSVKFILYKIIKLLKSLIGS